MSTKFNQPRLSTTMTTSNRIPAARNAQDTTDTHWAVLPPQAKRFILDLDLNNLNRNGVYEIDIFELLEFWSLPQHIEYTRGKHGSCATGAAWHLALIYLEQNRVDEARALTINGSFIQQCLNSSIEHVRAMCECDDIIVGRHLPHVARGIEAIKTRDKMDSYIHAKIPAGYNYMTSLFEERFPIDQISDEWNETSTSPSLKKGHSETLSNKGAQISLILIDDANREDRHSLDIGSSTSLKTLFNKYAGIRGSSLRSLRFSYTGKYLFLSSVGHKTPEELGMKDQDLIMVYDTSKVEQSNDNNRCSQLATTSKHTKSKKKKKSSANNNGKGNNKNTKPQHEKETVKIKTLEEHKIDHSKQLCKIYDEARPQFKQIRHRLNNLMLERQAKSKPNSVNMRKNGPLSSSMVANPFDEGIGGKAGNSHYMIHVGEVQNLYKSSKVSKNSQSALLTLDLHGCTRQDALIKLDESLVVWIDAAMQGSYPFVQPVMIVCGCGSQILSETVHTWIRSNNKVSNAPKVQLSRRRSM